MTYDFFADKSDKIQILDFIFNETDLRIYDLGSNYGEEICEYKNANEIESKFDLTNSSQHFQLWASRHKGLPIFRKVDLNPKYCNGHTFRYATEGWGLIQLYFEGLKNNVLKCSHIGHFNEKGAQGREDSYPDNGRVKDWDWTEIQSTSRKLNYQIHNKMAVRKAGSYSILSGAEELHKQGVKLWGIN